MAQTMRVSLPTYNALTEANIYRYSMYADSNNILIKEKARGSITDVDDTEEVTVTHSLGYYPHFFAYGQMASGRYRVINGFNFISFAWMAWTTSSVLSIQNRTGNNDLVTKYYIFYDNFVS